MSRPESCPCCLTEVPDWAAACPRCRYHPDSYNRAQDDVALIFRLSSSADRDCPESAPAATGAASPGWRTWLPHWLGGGGGQPPQAMV